MQSRIKKWGNSLGLRIPRGLADAAGIEENDVVELHVEKGKLVISRVARFDLDELLARVEDDNIHRQVVTGKPVGREIW